MTAAHNDDDVISRIEKLILAGPRLLVIRNANFHSLLRINHDYYSARALILA